MSLSLFWSDTSGRDVWDICPLKVSEWGSDEDDADDDDDADDVSSQKTWWVVFGWDDDDTRGVVS